MEFNRQIAMYLQAIEYELDSLLKECDSTKARLGTMSDVSGRDRELYKDFTLVCRIYSNFVESATEPHGGAGALVLKRIDCKVIGLSMPKCVWPQIQVCAGPSNTATESYEVFSILVTLSLPLLGLVVKYEGEMKQTSEPSGS